jgi:DNA modification methylase
VAGKDGPVTPYYEDAQVTLYHGDCLEETAWTEADVLVTDPPYGIAWSKGQWNKQHNPERRAGIQNDADTSARDGVLRQWGSKPALVFGSLKAEYPSGWARMLVFEKPRNSGLIGNRMPWFTNWEPVFVCGQWPDQTPSSSAVVRTRAMSASGYSGYATKTGHPHTKPTDVMEALINVCPLGVVADPFAGSGSTLVAARNLGRKAIGVEIEERYCELIASRLAQACFDFGEVS